MDVFPPQPGRGSIELDGPPPRPPASEQSGLMRASIPSPPEGGVGALGNSPNLMALQGLAILKHGLTLLSQALPEMAPMLNEAYMALEQQVPMMMANKLAGTGPAITGAAPPGVAPMMTPPPGLGGPGGPTAGPPMAGAPMNPMALPGPTRGPVGMSGV